MSKEEFWYRISYIAFISLESKGNIRLKVHLNDNVF